MGVSFWSESGGYHDPVVGVALHSGHLLRDEIKRIILLDENLRWRQETPHTWKWAKVCTKHFICNYSRFEVDLNRPPNKAIYRSPEDAWDFKVYADQVDDAILERSMEKYERFYDDWESCLDRLLSIHPHVVVLDLHTYNPQIEAGVVDPVLNPDVNIGTATLKDGVKWRSLINSFMDSIRSAGYFGNELDVRENVNFKGGYFAAWTHRHYEGRVCVLSVEINKFFVNEATGDTHAGGVAAIRSILEKAVAGLKTSLTQMDYI